jgi:hypothetical protein
MRGVRSAGSRADSLGALRCPKKKPRSRGAEGFHQGVGSSKSHLSEFADESVEIGTLFYPARGALLWRLLPPGPVFCPLGQLLILASDIEHILFRGGVDHLFR